MRYAPEHMSCSCKRPGNGASEAALQHTLDEVGTTAQSVVVELPQSDLHSRFESDYAFIAQAVLCIFDEHHEIFQTHPRELGPVERLVNYIDSCLSAPHRDPRENGCSQSAYPSDIARLSATARKRSKAVLRAINSIADITQTLGRSEPDLHAVSLLSELVGAAVISCSLSDANLAERILEVARGAIKSRIVAS
ncbi:hypothetical protein [Paraburkholderia fynbosensis]|uniref:Uncharacterized protein n=1 Tax=Paraburkholderia fynbosensis TaxID=1200993 RepID=A0A6J5GUS3_9BURK|nr:hypothetical protein [Paraburkholderia fynbosensis]CAB3807281.1 hypothetical protein LMG27177_06298 [Paraburkholderia fynbosensis]